MTDPLTLATAVTVALFFPTLYFMVKLSKAYLGGGGSRSPAFYALAYAGISALTGVLQSVIVNDWTPLYVFPFGVVSFLLALRMLKHYEEYSVLPELLLILSSNIGGTFVLGWCIGLRRILSLIAYYFWSAAMNPILLFVALWINKQYYKLSLPWHTGLLFAMCQVYNPHPASAYVMLAMVVGFAKFSEIGAPQFHMVMSNNIMLWLPWLAYFTSIAEYIKDKGVELLPGKWNFIDIWLIPGLVATPLSPIGIVVFGWTNVEVNLTILLIALGVGLLQILWWERADRPVRAKEYEEAL